MAEAADPEAEPGRGPTRPPGSSPDYSRPELIKRQSSEDFVEDLISMAQTRHSRKKKRKNSDVGLFHPRSLKGLLRITPGAPGTDAEVDDNVTGAFVGSGALGMESEDDCALLAANLQTHTATTVLGREEWQVCVMSLPAYFRRNKVDFHSNAAAADDDYGEPARAVDEKINKEIGMQEGGGGDLVDDDEDASHADEDGGEDEETKADGEANKSPAPRLPKVLLCMHGHGQNCCVGLWARFWTAMSDKGYNIIAFDSPGFGRSSGRRGQTAKWKPDDHQLVLRILRAFGCKEGERRVTTFGQCMGGAMFLRAYLAQPDMFAAHHCLHNCTIGTWPSHLAELLRIRGGSLLSFWEADDDHMREANVYSQFTALALEFPELCNFHDLEQERTGVGADYLPCDSASVPGLANVDGGDVYFLNPSAKAKADILDWLTRPPRKMARVAAPNKTLLQMGKENPNFKVYVRVRPMVIRF